MTVDASGAEPRLIVYDSRAARAFAYALDAGSNALTAEASFNIGVGWDIVEAFVANKSSYLMCYRGSGSWGSLCLPIRLSGGPSAAI
jgi:hypothetical protein